MKSISAMLAGAIFLAATSVSQSQTVPPEWEEHLLSRLTAEQMDEFLAGVDPSEIALDEGGTLNELLRRLEDQKRRGLLFYPVTPCVLLDASREKSPLADGEIRPIRLGRRTGDALKNRTCGAEVRVDSAQVALLTVEIRGVHGSGGTLRVGPGDGREASRFELSPTAGHGWTVTSDLCASDDSDLCPDGHLALAVEGTSAEVVVHLLGFYGPASVLVETEDATVRETPNDGVVADKALESPFWESGTGSGKIHYSDGFVGIGTVNPWAPLHVFGPDADYPDNKALRVHTYGESPNFRDHVVINGEAESGYGIAFSGQGHHRGGIYARNVGGSEAKGEITLWTRGGGNLRLLAENVGIGGEPQAKLHVKGSTQVDGSFRVNVGEGLLLEGVNDYWGANHDARRFRIRDGNENKGNVDGGLVFESWTEIDDQSFPLLSLRRTNGVPMVGIGTAFPGNPLKIHGYRNRATGTLRSTGRTVWGTGTAFDTELRVGSEIIVDGQVRKVTEVFGPDLIEVNNGFSPEVIDAEFWYTHRLMTVDSQGRMALGDLTPDDQLDVDGDIHATGQIETNQSIRIANLPPDDTTPSNSSINFYSREAGGSLHRWALHSASVGGGWGVKPNSLTIWEYDGRSCESENPVCEARMVFQPNTGFVGIGTDEPSARLEVNGDVRLSGGLRHDDELIIEAASKMTLTAGGDICIGQCD